MLALASVLMVLPLSAQQRIVKGTVTDDTGEPVAGASVMVAGTSRGVSTDLDGNLLIQMFCHLIASLIVIYKKITTISVVPYRRS